VINVIHTDIKDAGAVSEAVIAHPAVKRVNFTGSTRVGKMLAQIAAKYLKPILLELGGKAPLVVLDDADLDAAVNATVFGAFANAGQICMSTERVIVDSKVADEFAARLAKRVAALPVEIHWKANSSLVRWWATHNRSTAAWSAKKDRVRKCWPAAISRH
jgi:benzaldehyde dehydrogenase (NAD)